MNVVGVPAIYARINGFRVGSAVAPGGLIEGRRRHGEVVVARLAERDCFVSRRRTLGNRTLPDVLSADRDRIMASIRDQVNEAMVPFGVFVEDVRIRRADLPRENTEAILRANAERDRTVILADAKAQATRLYAAAFGQDPVFFGAWRRPEADREGFGSGKTRLILTP
jgi:modulator of FtsH protease HflC